MKPRPPAIGPLTPLWSWLIDNPEMAGMFILGGTFIIFCLVGAMLP